jgi:amino acid adenylation domain-containing protein
MTHPWENSYRPGVRWDGTIDLEPMTCALDRAAATWPDNIAVDFDECSLTFSQLRDLSGRVAKGLQSLGVGPQTSVGLHLPNSPHFVACFYGVLLAGGRAVPLSADVAEKELHLQLVDSESAVLITLDRSPLPPSIVDLKQAGLRTVIVCCFEDFISDQRAARLDRRPCPRRAEADLLFAELVANDGVFDRHASAASVDEIAALQFTGGTSGESKAAMLTHANFSVVPHAIGAWVQDLMSDSSRVLMVLPLHHVFGLVVMQASVAFGMRMVLHLGFSSENVLRSIERRKITVLFAVPTMYAALVSHPDAARYDLSSLQLCGSGGAPLSTEVFQKFLALTGRKIFEGYSLTEITDIGTWQPIGGEVRPGSVGLPLPHTLVEIVDLDSGLVVLPTQQVGEVCFRGPQLMKGYWRRPDETASVMRGGRFHSGDIGYLDEDGYVVLVDRKKNMILSGGMNVFPGKIERAIEQHPSVYEVIVVGVPDDALGQVAKAFIVLKPGSAKLKFRELKKFLADKLAAREMPVEMEIRDSLPKSSVGKLLKRALIPNPDPVVPSRLAEPPTARSADNGTTSGKLWKDQLRQADRSRRGRLIREALQEEVACVLSLPNADSVVFDGPLVEIGLDSLLAVELRNALGERFSMALPGTLAFDYPTPEAIANYLEQLLASDASAEIGGAIELVSEVHPDQEGRLVNLSSGQRSLWFLDHLAAGIPLYNLHAAWRVRGPLDLPLLRRCFSMLAQRHESARTLFVNVAGEPRALVLPSKEGRLDIEFADLRNDPDRALGLQRLWREQRTRPFDLTSGPLWRAAIFAVEQEEHVLLLTQHHIISDALSVTHLFDELVRLYRGNADESTLQGIRLHYSDYVRWQKAQAQDETYLASLAWWKQQLAGLPRVDLPESRSVPMPSHAGNVSDIWLSSELSNRVRELARREGCTLFKVLLSAWACVLSRHSGQFDLPIGTFVGGRHRAEFSNMVGFFVNTVVLRCDLSGNPTFRTLLDRIQGTVVDVLHHHHVPFDAVVREMAASRGDDLNPLLQTSFNLVSALRDGETPGCSWEWLDASRGGSVDGTAKFNITLTLIDDPAGLKGTLEYATDMFEHDAIERLGKHLEVVLGAAVETIDTTIDELPLLSDEERAQLLHDWNRTDYASDTSLCIHETVALQAGKDPAAIAVYFGERRLSYGELDQRANQIAGHLRSMGMPPQARVGICLDRSCELIVALLAILKAGASYVPLDPSYPRERLAFMLDDARVFALVTTASIAARWPDHPVRLLRLDVDAETIDRQSVAPVENSVSPDSLAYVIYTSGSTGRPKGVEISHAALRNTLAHFARQLSVTAEDVLLAVTSLSFDIAALEIFMPLMQGAAIRLMSREQTLDGRVLARESSRATIMQATPATWGLLLDAGWTGNNKLRALCGGEALPWPLALKLLDRANVVWNCYGPTETTVWSTTWRVERNAGRALLGRAIANTRLYVLDGNGELVPVGVPGELYIGGASVGRGYLGRDTLTAERFLPDRYSNQANARVYRTGDKVRWTAQGDLEFLGRLDDQIKMRGFRIELGEIEQVLARHAEVLSCVVAVCGSGDASRLVAYYISDTGKDVAAKLLQDHLERELPFYMMPSTFVRLKEFPLTPNKKVDRAALPEPEIAPALELRRAPASDLQRAMVGVWRELLHLEPDVQRSFFEQGGTSLQIVRLQHLMRERLGIETTIAELMTYPSIEALARRIEGRKKPAAAPVDGREAAAAKDIDHRRLEIARLSDVESSDSLRARLDRLRGERQAAR